MNQEGDFCGAQLQSVVARLTIQLLSGGDVRLSWPQGVLLEAANPTGPWSTNSAASPYTNAPAGAKKFYRVLVQ